MNALLSKIGKLMRDLSGYTFDFLLFYFGSYFLSQIHGTTGIT